MADIEGARQHYDANKAGRAWYLEIKGQDNRDYQPVEGRYRVVAPYRAGGFLIAADGGIRSVCRSEACDWYPESSRLEEGEAEQTTLLVLRLRRIPANELREALEVVTTTGRVYLSGSVGSRHLASDPPAVSFGNGTATLSYATIDHLESWGEVPLRDVDLTITIHHKPGEIVPPIEVEDGESEGLPEGLRRWVE